jgi:hypothetical protein
MPGGSLPFSSDAAAATSSRGADRPTSDEAEDVEPRTARPARS